MALAYQGVSCETLGAQHIGTDDAVAYVRFGAGAVYRRGIAAHYTYIVEHRGATHKLAVGVDSPTVETFESLSGHAFAVNRQGVSQFASGRVIFVDNSLIVRHFLNIVGTHHGAPGSAICEAGAYP